MPEIFSQVELRIKVDRQARVMFHHSILNAFLRTKFVRNPDFLRHELD
jgi:hypothetical protein